MTDAINNEITKFTTRLDNLKENRAEEQKFFTDDAITLYDKEINLTAEFILALKEIRKELLEDELARMINGDKEHSKLDKEINKLLNKKYTLSKKLKKTDTTTSFETNWGNNVVLIDGMEVLRKEIVRLSELQSERRKFITQIFTDLHTVKNG